MKSNQHKKATYENRFSRRYACWVKNNRKKWRACKKRNCRQYRRILKQEMLQAQKLEQPTN